MRKVKNHQVEYIKALRRLFPEYFKGGRVLEIGSLTVRRGYYKKFFEADEYIGLDVVPGKNVDVVCVAHKYDGGDFDVVFSISSLEHDLYFARTLAKMFDCCRGLMFFSAANLYPRHGVSGSNPGHSGTSRLGGEWGDYYKNITSLDVSESLDLTRFSKYEVSILGYEKKFIDDNSNIITSGFRRDIRFWGRVRGG